MQVEKTKKGECFPFGLCTLHIKAGYYRHIRLCKSVYKNIFFKLHILINNINKHIHFVAFNSNPTDSQVATRYAGGRGRALLAMLCAMLVGLAWVLSTSALPRHKTRK